eukprot:COSAG01_NODE_415_length_17322_cov_14.785926_5_plen_196_part_00
MPNARRFAPLASAGCSRRSSANTHWKDAAIVLRNQGRSKTYRMDGSSHHPVVRYRFPRLPQVLITTAVLVGGLIFAAVGILIFAIVLSISPQVIQIFNEYLFVFLLVSSCIIVPGAVAVIAAELMHRHSTKHQSQRSFSLFRQAISWAACAGVGFAQQLILRSDFEEIETKHIRNSAFILAAFLVVVIISLLAGL